MVVAVNPTARCCRNSCSGFMLPRSVRHSATRAWPPYASCLGRDSSALLALSPAKIPDIARYHRKMSDVLIRDIPDDVLASLDAVAARLGLSRTEYIRRRLAQDAQTARVTVTAADLRRLRGAVAGLGDPELMRQAWR